VAYLVAIDLKVVNLKAANLEPAHLQIGHRKPCVMEAETVFVVSLEIVGIWKMEYDMVR
jgi:hypothetical protein